MRVGSDSSYGNLRCLVRFNLPLVPFGAVIESASLQAWYSLCSYSSECDEMEAHVHRLTWPFWRESTATWDNMGSASAPEVFASVLLPSGYASLGQWIEWDVTDLVNGWYRNSYSNFGLAIHGHEGPPENYKSFSTKDLGSGREPRLIVYWHLTTPTLTITRTPTPTRTLTGTTTATATPTPSGSPTGGWPHAIMLPLLLR